MLGNVILIKFMKPELKTERPGGETKHKHTVSQVVQVIILEKYKEGRHSNDS